MTTSVRERQRAALILATRMRDLGLTPTTLARRSGVDPTTIRAILRGDRTPSLRVKAAVAPVLGWPVGELARRAERVELLATLSNRELLGELCRRHRDGTLLPPDSG